MRCDCEEYLTMGILSVIDRKPIRWLITEKQPGRYTVTAVFQIAGNPAPYPVDVRNTRKQQRVYKTLARAVKSILSVQDDANIEFRISHQQQPTPAMTKYVTRYVGQFLQQLA